MARIEPFRPTYTRRIASRLIQGEVICLLGQDRHGATRLAKDIQEIFPQARYLDAQGLSSKAIVSEISESETDDWNSLIAGWKRAGVSNCLVINHVTANAFGEDEASARSVLQQLLSLSQAGLLMLSDRPIPEFEGMEGLSVEKLPPIGYKRMKEEILRYFPEEKDWNSVAAPIFSHPEPYPLLQHVLEQRGQHPEYAEHPPEQWVAQLVAAFNQANGLDEPAAGKKSTGIWDKLKGWRE